MAWLGRGVRDVSGGGRGVGSMRKDRLEQAARWLAGGRRGYQPAMLGMAAEQVVQQLERGRTANDGELAQAWLRAVPAEHLAHSRVEGLVGGRLNVLTDGADTKYVLARLLGKAVIDAMNRELGARLPGRAPVVRHIRYRVDARGLACEKTNL